MTDRPPETPGTLPERERLLALALDAARMVAWTWDPRQDRVETVGDLAGIYGVSAVDLAEQGFALIHPDDAGRHRQIVDRALASGQPYRSEFRIRRGDNGQIVWIEERGAPVLNAAGQLVKLTGTVMDVSHRHQSEAALSLARAELEQTFASMDQAVVVLDFNTKVVLAANPALARIFGYRPEELLGRSTEQLHVDPAHFVEFGEKFVQATGQGQTLRTEYSMRRRDGQVFLAEITANEIRDESGQRRAAVGIVRDISQRRQSEEAVHHTRQLLERALERSARLQSVTAALAPALAAGEVVDIVLAQSTAALGASAAAIYLLEQNGQALTMAGSLGYPEAVRERVQRLPLDGHMPGADVFQQRQALWLRSSEEFNRRYPNLQTTREVSNNEALALIPLVIDEQALGVLALSFAQPRQFEPDDQDLLVTLARQCAQALERARLYEAERRARAEAEAAQRRMSILAEASASLVSSLDVQATLKTITQLLLPRVADYCLIYRLSENGQWRVTATHAQPRQEQRLSELARTYRPNLLASDSLLARVLRSGQTVLVEDMPALPPRPEGENRAVPDIIQELGAISALGVPMSARGGVFGAIMLMMADSGRHYSESDLPLVEALASRAALALENASLYETAQRLNADLERRVQARTAELLQSQHRLAEAQHLARLGSWHWDVASNRLSWSDELCRIYGLDPTAIPKTYEQYVALIHPEDREQAQTIIQRAQALRQPFAFDHRIVRPDGSVRTLHGQGQLIENKQGELVAMAGTGQDITERKQIEDELGRSHQQLRRLSAHLEGAREEERARMAREIHDELGGMLTGLKMDLAQLRRAAGSLEPRAQEKLEAFSQSIDQSVEAVRRIASELRPAILDDFGLLAAMEWHLGEFQRRSGLECVWDSRVDELQLPSDASIAMYRVFQESLTNVARHAGARRVEVSVSTRDGRLVLQVSDNGRGITREELLGTKSLGLTGMRERISLLGGQLEIGRAAGQGTLVRVELPLNA
jgi:PAS domain S-box-containing protein